MKSALGMTAKLGHYRGAVPAGRLAIIDEFGYNYAFRAL
jgi:hypothetical protein